MAINTIFLSGWEYNRLTSNDPFQTHSSGLPAQVLWCGSSQFWLFETVYCTREALEGDYSGYQALKWSTGYIFKDLERRGFIRTVDISECAKNDQLLKDGLELTHSQFRSQHDENLIFQLLEAGDEEALEAIKCNFLAPLFDHLGCAKNFSKNSIGHWIETKKPKHQHNAADGEFIRQICDPIASSISTMRIGTPLCRPPGTGLPAEILIQQRQIEETIQKPMIPSLLAGKLANTDYLKALEPTAHVYKEINKQLLLDYNENIKRLERVRDAASKHLWPSLHRDWLPNLRDDPSFVDEFKTIMNDALNHSKLRELKLETETNIAIIGLAGLLGYCTAATANASGLDANASAAVGGTVGLWSRELLSQSYQERLSPARPLIAFYQDLRQSKSTN